MPLEENVGEFNRDVLAGEGYLYTRGDKLSCSLSNHRMTSAILAIGDLAGKRVLDIGCGDGTYSRALAAAGAKEVLGLDAAEAAIESARRKFAGCPGLRFEVADVYSLPEPEARYDLAVARGLLHHLYDAPKAVESISRMAREIIVVEPNGYNPVLKLIEKLSPYHRAHEEKSYRPSTLERWFRDCGGRIERTEYIGLVPMFCPDWLARLCKWLEPNVERTPLVRQVCCAQYVQKVVTDETR